MTNDGWIEWKWTEEKPYPETLETLVYVRFEHDDNWTTKHPDPVSNWAWFNVPRDRHPHDITHYKVAK